jgi:hypothetical protein
MAIGARTPSKKETQQMMIPSNFAMNIARQVKGQNGPFNEHFCSIELGPILPEKARERARIIAERFPLSEGWSVTLSKVTCYGEEMPIENY